MAQAQTGEMAFRMERQERRQGEASSPALEEEVGQGRSAPTGLCGDRGHIPLVLVSSADSNLTPHMSRACKGLSHLLCHLISEEPRETGMGMRAVSLTVGFWAVAHLRGSPDFGSPRGTSVVGRRDQTAWVEGWWQVRLV